MQSMFYQRLKICTIFCISRLSQCISISVSRSHMRARRALYHRPHHSVQSERRSAQPPSARACPRVQWVLQSVSVVFSQSGTLFAMEHRFASVQLPGSQRLPNSHHPELANSSCPALRPNLRRSSSCQSPLAISISLLHLVWSLLT